MKTHISYVMRVGSLAAVLITSASQVSAQYPYPLPNELPPPVIDVQPGYIDIIYEPLWHQDSHTKTYLPPADLTGIDFEVGAIGFTGYFWTDAYRNYFYDNNGPWNCAQHLHVGAADSGGEYDWLWPGWCNPDYETADHSWTWANTPYHQAYQDPFYADADGVWTFAVSNSGGPWYGGYDGYALEGYNGYPGPTIRLFAYVPEPGTLGLLAIGGVTLLRRR